MTDAEALPRATTFVVWAPRHRGTRSAWLAAELGIDPPHYFPAAGGRGLRAAPGKYPAQLVRTIGHLLRRRPRAIFVQSPPSFALDIQASHPDVRCTATPAADRGTAASRTSPEPDSVPTTRNDPAVDTKGTPTLRPVTRTESPMTCTVVASSATLRP